jgi:hypothetical protein
MGEVPAPVPAFARNLPSLASDRDLNDSIKLKARLSPSLFFLLLNIVGDFFSAEQYLFQGRGYKGDDVCLSRTKDRERGTKGMMNCLVGRVRMRRLCSEAIS